MKKFYSPDADTAGGGGAPVNAAPAANVDAQQAVVENKPDSRQFIGTVADVSNTIKRNGREFRIITFIDENGKTVTFAVSENFYLNNKTRLAPDVTLNVAVEHSVAGKTTWYDRETEQHNVHTTTGDNIRNVILATSEQTKMSLLDKLEDKLKGYAEQPALLGPMAELFKAALR